MVRKRKDWVELEEVLTAARAANWQTKLSADKCEMVHTGRHHPTFPYTIVGSELTITFLEQGPRAVIASSRNTPARLAALRKANQMK